jgi:tetratricopeptide (TPR) repeat protein
MRLLILRGRSLNIDGHLDAAIRAYDEALSLGPDNVDAMALRTNAAVDRNDIKDATERAKRILTIDPKRAEVYNALGVLANKNGDRHAAEALYDRAIALQPDYVQARMNRLRVFSDFGDQKRVISEAEAILSLGTSELDTLYSTFDEKRATFRIQARLERALAVARMGNTEMAEQVFKELISLEPTALSFTMRARFKFDRNHFEEALLDLERAEADDPNYWRIHYVKGQSYIYLSRPLESIASFTKALELNPKSGEARWLRAMAERALGRLDEALNDALMAVASDPRLRERKFKMLLKVGYLPPSSGENAPAVADAVRACMLDEHCW